MKKGGKGFSVAVLSAVALGAVGIGVILAFLAGYFLGHSTGHTNTTTVSVIANAPEGESLDAEEEEAKAAEEEEAKAAEEEEAKAAEEEEAKAEEEAQAEKEEAAPEPEKPMGEEQGEAKKESGSGAEGGGASLAAGETAFKTNCAGCHTLAAAGTTGTVGPNLDQLMPDQSLVETQVTNGGGGMPAFGGSLSPGEIEAIAEYVSTVAGSGGG